MAQQKKKILFVCMGNICRSPTAHGIFEQLVKQEKLSHLFEIESAGTSSRGWHEGDLPDPNSIAAAAKKGLDITYIRSRQLIADDFRYYDHILVMDKRNLRDAKKICQHTEYEKKLDMFLEYNYECGLSEVPDPYYEGGFDEVYEMLGIACKNYLEEIR